VTPARERVADALVLALAKVAVGAWVLHQGFTHVSDDDYARTVIAQQLAHAPRLDPSATSWLPLPFWLEGAAMTVAGRTLGVARAVAVVLGAASVAAPYLAMRAAGMRRAAAMVATAVTMALPWNAWLGVATVPEGWVGAVAAAGIVSMDRDVARPWAAAALLAASLSRYEAWPACAVLAALCAWRATHGGARRRELVCAAVALAGPAAWLAWNAHAHGDALHFLARVTTFRRAIGAADVPLGDKLLGYPRALVEETPEVAVLGALGLLGLAARPLRERWRWPALTVLAVVAFLVVGDVRDGAPTHHPARALTAVWWVLAAMGIDALFTRLTLLASGAPLAQIGRRHRSPVWLTAVAATLGAAWCVSLPARWGSSPGRSEAERREPQIARGMELRARGVEGAVVTPCAFEHFALLAAWGAPERATVEPRTGQTPTATCPDVVER
jgi:hypothetical protein